MGLLLLIGALGFVSFGHARAPVPTDAKVLVAELQSGSEQVRNSALNLLKTRPDAAPWLRRMAKGADRDAGQLAGDLLAEFAKKRQAAAKPAIDACIRDGRADLFVEWHHFWQPENKADLWLVGPRAGKLALDAVQSDLPGGFRGALDTFLKRGANTSIDQARYLDGPFEKLRKYGPWYLRTDRVESPSAPVAFASVSGRASKSDLSEGYWFVLGDVHALSMEGACVVTDGDLSGVVEADGESIRGPTRILSSFIACRGNAYFPRVDVQNTMIVVDGDIDFSRATLRDCAIRATGEIRLPVGVPQVNCKFDAYAKNATSPYKFFELSDVGLSLVDDEEGLVVADVKPNTPFGTSGLKKGDIIQAIDDVAPGHSSEFRRKVRRSLVRQGDCLITVARGNKTLDLPVYFPLPRVTRTPVLATIYHSVGINPETIVYNHLNQPRELVKGEVVSGILS